jgi:heptosyltransferase II
MTPKKTEKSIGILSAGWLGDNIMLNSLMQRVKETGCHLTLINTHPAFDGLFERMTEVDACLTHAIPHGRLALGERIQLAKKINALALDQIIVAPNSWKAGFIAKWARIPRRTGWLGEARYGLLNDYRRLNKDAYPTMVSRYHALGGAQYEKPSSIEACHRPKLIASRDNLKACLKKKGLPARIPKRIIALCPGAAYGPSKQWPADYFATIAKHYLGQGWQVWLMGGPSDQATTALIQQKTQNRCVDWAGTTSIADAIDLLSVCKQVLANDSGLMHMAAAVNTPVVAIYGSTLPEFAPPLHPAAQIATRPIACRPCKARVCPLGHTRCLTQLKPNYVLRILESQL